MTKDLAYTRPLVCRMWALLGPYVQKHNYSVWRDMDCSVGPGEEPFPPIQDVNVGPRGEYNHQWVKPGKPLLDFGGHDDFKRKPASEAAVKAPDSEVTAQRGGKQGGGKGLQAGAGGKRMGGRGVIRAVPNKGHGLRVMGDGAKGAEQKASSPTDVKSESVASVGSGANSMGMSMEEARNIPGVGKVGETKPAWM